MQDYGIVTCSRHLNLTDFEVGASCSIALYTVYEQLQAGV